MIHRYSFWAIAIFSIAVSVLFFLLSISSLNTYSVSGRTEIADFKVPVHTANSSTYISGPLRNIFPLRNVKIWTGDGIISSNFTGTMSVLPGANIRFQRSGIENKFIILIENDAKTGKIIQLIDSSDEVVNSIAVNTIIDIPLSDMETPYTIPMNGIISVGSIVKPTSSPNQLMLLSAEVKINARPALGWIFNKLLRFEIDRFNLDQGDLARINSDGKDVLAVGFVRFDNQPGFKVTYHAQGNQISIRRFGAEGYNLRPSMWVKLAKDPHIQVFISVLAATIFGLLTWVAGSRVREEVAKLREAEKSDRQEEI